jgi:hypothetical protein
LTVGQAVIRSEPSSAIPRSQIEVRLTRSLAGILD